MKVCVTFVPDEQLIELDLPHDAIIRDVKMALAEEEGFKDPINRLRVFYKNDSGDALGKLSERKLSDLLLDRYNKDLDRTQCFSF